MLAMKRLLVLICGLLLSLAAVRADAQVVISEFVARNTAGLTDEDNSREDWIEIYNAGATNVPLLDWSLTDSAANLTKWRFPATNIAPGRFLIVWASGKNRRVPGAPLHTNFRLEENGEYLALVRPDLSVATEFAPNFPQQVQNIGFGQSFAITNVTLFTTGAAARVHVPASDVLGTNWIDPGFSDAGWGAAVTPVGFVAPVIPPPLQPGGAVLADSVAEFSGTQGQDNWFYGFYNRTADGNATYDPETEFNTTDANWGFTGGNWVLGAGGDLNANPPWDTIGATSWHPNGVNNVEEHWVVRRWVAETNGLIHIAGTLSHPAASDGTRLHVFVDGTEVGLFAVANSTTEFAVNATVSVGSKVDFALDAGPAGQDGADSTTVTFKIYQNILADSVADWTTAGIQGARGWSYGYFNRVPGNAAYTHAGFTPFTRGALADTTISAGNQWDGTRWNVTADSPGLIPYTELSQTGGRPSVASAAQFPSAGATNWPVRRWTSTYTGLVRVSGLVAHLGGTGTGTDGVTAFVMVDGATVYSRSFNVLNLAWSAVVAVTNGSRLDFVINPNSTDTNDAVTFTATVQPVGAADITTLADSVADWTGGQGGNGWYFGWYNRTADGDAAYDATNDFNRTDPSWTFASSTWQLGVPGSPTANPPWTDVSQFRQHPNGTNQAAPNMAEHWSVRRWVSEVSGAISIHWHMGKQGAAGNGTTVYLMQNGVVRDTASIAGTDTVGTSRLVSLDVQLGDFIDFALSPYGPGGLGDDGSDGTFVNAIIYGRSSQTAPLGTVVADSTADWSATGVQGFRGWYYGFYNKTFDASPGYDTGDFNNTDPNWSFTGGVWQLGTNGNPLANAPWDNIGQTQVHPNGTNSVYLAITNEHHVIRRWVSTVSGPHRVEYFIAKGSSGGNGTTALLYHNGVLKDQATIGGANTTGERHAINITLTVGDILDFALSPLGTDFLGADGTDTTTFTATVLAPLSLTNVIATDIRAPMHNSNATVYLRVPFNLSDPTVYDLLKLRMKYDDGFVAYLNGVEVARRFAPSFAVGGLFADSTNDWAGTSAQGVNGWSYGYYNRSLDPNLAYDPATDFNTTDPNWIFSGGWALGPGDPPWTSLGRDTWHPNGSNNGAEHWPVRRWVSEANGNVNARLFFAKQNVGGGNGTTLRVFVNGLQRFSRTIGGTDGTGLRTNLVLEGLSIGDLVEFALDALGTDGTTADGSDGSFFGVVIDQTPSAPLGWNSAALVTAPTAAAQSFEEFDISAYRGFLVAGQNVLAIHGLNVSADDPDFFLLPELAGTTIDLVPGSQVYFTPPTPNAVNGAGTTNLGPYIVAVNNVPRQPCDLQDTHVTAQVEQTFDPVAGVTLFYRVNYNAEIPLAMADDGAHFDGAAGDGVWGATIPETAYTNGQMVRWRVVATDTTGDSLKSPPFDDPLNSPEYWGTVVCDPNLTNPLPVLHWFTQNAAGANTAAGARGSIYYNGQFFDNIMANLHGQSSQGFPKRAYDFDLNRGFKLKWRDDMVAVDDFNLLTTWADKTFMRNEIAYGIFGDAGAPTHFAFPVRVQQNNAFFSVASFVENGDDNFLKRLGLDDEGALYKIYNTLNTASSGAEKKTRKTEANTDLQTFINNLSGGNPARHAYMFDNVNLPEVINYWAARTLTADTDWGHKNYYVYRDTRGSGEWQVLPWDLDLSLGHNWTGQYFDDNFVTNSSLTVATGNNTLFTNLFNHPLTREMYWRRLRTLMDELFQTNGTPRALDKLQEQFDRNTAALRPDVALDVAKWGTWNHGSSAQVNIGVAGIEVLLTNMARMSNVFLTGRRAHLFHTSAAANGGQIPAAQAANPAVTLWNAEVSPTNSNQDQEWIALTNAGPVAVDISGWQLDGGVRFTFAGGTVISPSNVLYIARDLVQWRARTLSPKGGETNYVVGPFKGTLDARGEGVTLANKGGSIVSSNYYNATPTAAQLYLRVTEVMYNPAPGGAFGQQEYEYFELKNISGALDIDLVGVAVTNGVSFVFTAASPVTNLGPGETMVLVKNAAAFASRYGFAALVAGQFVGSLDSNGERLRLLDARNEEVLDFSYDNQWYPITDGLGFSLVVVDENAAPGAWDNRSQWRPSGAVSGSPGDSEPVPPAIPGVLVNEVLTRTMLPAVDAVELFNPTAGDVNIGGWYLSDDFGTPHKFRIPNGTMITAGTHRVFTEADFNPGGAGFSFSASGDEVFLFSGESGGTNLTGYFHGFDFGGADDGVSFGRYVNSQGAVHFVGQTAATLGFANAGPRVGPLVIGEFVYHPPDNADGTDNELYEFIEIHNPGPSAVPLYDPANPANTWRLTEAVDFDFPTNLTLGPCDSIVVVSFDPANDWPQVAAFRARYALPLSTPLVGPWSGKLDNSADAIELKKPGLPVLGVAPGIMVDKVSYGSAAPWPAAADGTGRSLRRLSDSAYGNDVINWTDAAASPGTTIPVVQAQPAGVSVAQGDPVALSVAVCGTQLVTYQWRTNGVPLAGRTNATISFPVAQFSHAGGYDVVVASAAGSVTSSVAVLTVFDATPPVVTCPGNIVLDCDQPAGRVVTFSITVTDNHDTGLVAVCVPPSGGVFPPGVTTVNCSATDAATNTGTCSFTITINEIIPAFVTHPQSRTNNVGTTATFNTVVSGCTALTYQWNRNGTPLLDETNVSLSILAVALADAGSYSVTVTSHFGSITSTVAVVTVNRPPVAADNGATTTTGTPAVISSAKLLRNDSDDDGDPLVISTVSATSTNGGTVTLGGGNVTYTPLPGFAGLDRFTYTVSDGRGGFDTADVEVFVADGTVPADNKVSMTMLPNGNVVVRFAGVPGRTYEIQRSTDLLNWSPLASVVAPLHGLVEYEDAAPPMGGAFYRMALP